jgi:hypothetical protein
MSKSVIKRLNQWDIPDDKTFTVLSFDGQFPTLELMNASKKTLAGTEDTEGAFFLSFDNELDADYDGKKHFVLSKSAALLPIVKITNLFGYCDLIKFARNNKQNDKSLIDISNYVFHFLCHFKIVGAMGNSTTGTNKILCSDKDNANVYSLESDAVFADKVNRCFVFEVVLDGMNIKAGNFIYNSSDRMFSPNRIPSWVDWS